MRNSIIPIFKQLFWQNKTCRNLFLLSKLELLDTKEISYDGSTTYVSFPRIILSNINKGDEHELAKINIRSESNAIFNQGLIDQTMNLYQPIITKFLQDRLGNSFNKIIEEINKSPGKFVLKTFKLFMNDKEHIEGSVLDLLKSYEFIPRHLKSFNELDAYFHKETIHKKFKEIFSEENIFNLLEFLKSLKEIHNHYTYKSLYNSNQILVNALHSNDDFESRIKLFDLLYEAEVIMSSIDDSFVECTSCENGTYKGNLVIKINPSKLKNLTCPVCNKPLSYYVPFDMDEELFDMINSKDGLILYICEWLLKEKDLPSRCNITINPDIELDCVFEFNGINYVIETKMYKLSNDENRIHNKLRAHLGKLKSDVEIIKQMEEYQHLEFVPILITNYNKVNGLSNIEKAFNSENTSDIQVRLMDIEGFKKLITQIKM